MIEEPPKFSQDSQIKYEKSLKFDEFAEPAKRMLNAEPQLDVPREKQVNTDPEAPVIELPDPTAATQEPAPEEGFINSVPGMDPIPTPDLPSRKRVVISKPGDPGYEERLALHNADQAKLKAVQRGLGMDTGEGIKG